MSGAQMMMQLGEFQFGLDTAAYQVLQRSSSWRWSALERPGGVTALQYAGRDCERIRLPGVIYPEWRGGHQQVEQMRLQAERGQPLLMVDGRGRVLGDWVIERVDEQQSVFAHQGMPRKIEFSLQLRRFEWADEQGGSLAGLRPKHLGWPSGPQARLMRDNETFASWQQQTASMPDAGGLVAGGRGSQDLMLSSEQGTIARRQLDYLRARQRRGREKWWHVRKKASILKEDADKSFRKSLHLGMEKVDSLFKALTDGKAAGPSLGSAAGALKRVADVHGKLLRQSERVGKILGNERLARLAQGGGVRKEKLERMMRDLERVSKDVARAQMFAESASANLQKDAARFEKDPFTLRKLMDSDTLAPLMEAGVVSRKTIERCRQLHDRIAELVKEVGEEVRQEREAREKRTRDEDGGVVEQNA